MFLSATTLAYSEHFAMNYTCQTFRYSQWIIFAKRFGCYSAAHFSSIL